MSADVPGHERSQRAREVASPAACLRAERTAEETSSPAVGASMRRTRSGAGSPGARERSRVDASRTRIRPRALKRSSPVQRQRSVDHGGDLVGVADRAGCPETPFDRSRAPTSKRGRRQSSICRWTAFAHHRARDEYEREVVSRDDPDRSSAFANLALSTLACCRRSPSSLTTKRSSAPASRPGSATPACVARTCAARRGIVFEGALRACPCTLGKHFARWPRVVPARVVRASKGRGAVTSQRRAPSCRAPRRHGERLVVAFHERPRERRRTAIDAPSTRSSRARPQATRFRC